MQMKYIKSAKSDRKEFILFSTGQYSYDGDFQAMIESSELTAECYNDLDL